MQQPEEIKYWVNDKPPLPVAILAAVQQISLLGTIMTLSLVLGRTLGLEMDEQIHLVALTMVSAGIGVILQTLNRNQIGIGLFVPMHTTSAAFPAMTIASQMGGLGLAFGMLSVVGVVQLVVSKIITRMKEVIPVEIAGLAVFIIGIEVGLLGLRNILGIGTELENDSLNAGVGFSTLALIIGLTIWGPPILKAFAVISGLILGQILAIWVGLVPAEDLMAIANSKLFEIPPIGEFGWKVDWRLIPDFAIVGIALSLNCFGIMTVAQKSYDASWKRPDIEGVKRGLMAEGLTNIATSFINGVSQTSSGPAVGLALTSGIVSRIVAYILGGMFIVLAFFPPVTYLWNSLSTTVVGAILLFVGGIITITGLRILMLRLLDSRRTIAIGLAIIGGVGSGLLARIADEEAFYFALFSTPLALSLSIAIVLNAFFLINSRKKLTYEVPLVENWHKQLDKMIWELGKSWGASPETVARIIHSLNELTDVVTGHELISEDNKKIYISARFYQSFCTVKFFYTGEGFRIVDKPPTPEQMLEDPDSVTDLAGYLVRQIADGIKISTQRNNTTVITLEYYD